MKETKISNKLIKQHIGLCKTSIAALNRLIKSGANLQSVREIQMDLARTMKFLNDLKKERSANMPFDFTEAVKFLQNDATLDDLRSVVYSTALGLAYTNDESMRLNAISEAQSTAILVLDFLSKIKPC